VENRLFQLHDYIPECRNRHDVIAHFLERRSLSMPYSSLGEAEGDRRIRG